MSERESTQSQTRGKKKYREWIHEDTKRIDNNSNLPFTFSKPTKSKPSNVYLKCSSCDKDIYVTIDAIVTICGSCGNLNRVKAKV